MPQLSYHPKRSPRDILHDLAEWTDPAIERDHYGRGELMADFETEMAELLGQEAAIFVPTGKLAQLIAMRVWCDRRGVNTVAFHHTCHLEIHEAHAYRHLHGLDAILVGEPECLITLEDLQRQVDASLGALLLELPQREIGGQLPTWDELTAQVEWARRRRIPLHLDGARLWECKPYYGKDYADIAGLFDSVYVSFYKIIGGIAGAVLAGDQALVDEARVWNKRHGGEVVNLYPFVLSAQKGLAERLERIPAYMEKAREIVAAITALDGVVCVPDPPPTNMTQVHLRGEIGTLKTAHEVVKEQTGLELFWGLRQGVVPGHVYFEFVAGDSTLDVATAEVVAAFEMLLAEAG